MVWILVLLFPYLLLAQGPIPDGELTAGYVAPDTPEVIELVINEGRPERALTQDEQATVAAGGSVDGGVVWTKYTDAEGRVWWTDQQGHSFCADQLE